MYSPCWSWPARTLDCGDCHHYHHRGVVHFDLVALAISYIIILSTLRTRASEAPASPLHLWSTHHCGLQVLLVSHLHLCPRGWFCQELRGLCPVLHHDCPMFNPLISTLRNADMKNAMRKVWGWDKHSAGKWASGCPALCGIYFIHTVVNVDKCDRYTEGACAVIQSCDPEEWSPLSHSPSVTWRRLPTRGMDQSPLGPFPSDIREHSVICIPWHDECISALFFRESCEDCLIGFSEPLSGNR